MCNNRDVALHIATYLPPESSFNFLTSSKLISNEVSGMSFPSLFMNRSLKTSLFSVMGQRDEFGNGRASSFLSDMERLAREFDGGLELAISGSLIVQAILHGGGSTVNDAFQAGDIDIYTTADRLSCARTLLKDHGFVFRGVSVAKYESFNSGVIHHVESFSVPPDIDPDITTFGKAIEDNLVGIHTKKILGRAESEYALDPSFPYIRKAGLDKHVDLVVCDSLSVRDTIQRFDISPCRSCFDGISFRIPNIAEIFDREATLTSANWANLLNRYVSAFLQSFSLEDFGQLPLVSGHHVLSEKRFQVISCFHALAEEGDVLFPDKKGHFRGRRPRLYGDYCITLHNALVKISKRVMKYSKLRNFHFTDIHVDELVRRPHGDNQADPFFMHSSSDDECEEDDEDEDGNEDGNEDDDDVDVEPVTVYETRSQQGRHYCIGEPSKRAKLMHNNNLSSPVIRAKTRILDTNGIDTTSLYALP